MKSGGLLGDRSKMGNVDAWQIKSDNAIGEPKEKQMFSSQGVLDILYIARNNVIPLHFLARPPAFSISQPR